MSVLLLICYIYLLLKKEITCKSVTLHLFQKQNKNLNIFTAFLEASKHHKANKSIGQICILAILTLTYTFFECGLKKFNLIDSEDV